MNPNHTLRARTTVGVVAGAATLALALVTTGCDAVSTPGRRPAASASGSAEDRLPAEIRQRGYLTVATDPTYPPFETLSDGQETIVGLDPDLLTEIGNELDVEIRFARASFDSIIPGLRAGRYDLAVSGMTDTKERQAQVTFVDYFNAGGAIVMSADAGITTDALPDALCGESVGVQTGTITVGFSQAASKQCETAEKKPIDLQMFPSVPASVLAMSSGRIDYVWTDNVAAAAQVENGKGELTSINDGTPPAPTGMAFPKESAELAEAVRTALQTLIDDGRYQKALAKYGLADGAVASAEVNGANR